MSKQTKKTSERGEKEPTAAVTGEETDGGVSATTLVEILRDQQRLMKDQQESQRQILMEIIEQQRAEMAKHRDQMTDILARAEAGAGKDTTKVSLPKPTLQKLSVDDDVEHFLEMFERTAKQRDWPKDVWAMQLAGLLTGKAMAAYANLEIESANDYQAVKQAILRRYQVNVETHRQQFRQDRKKSNESYAEWADRLRDRFAKWKRDREISVEKMILLEQFIAGVPEGLAIALKEKEPKSLTEAAELADTYALAREDGGKGGAKETTPLGTAPRANKQESRRVEPSGPGEQKGRDQTNQRGEKRCFQCNRFGHMMYNCPYKKEASTPARPKALYGGSCQEVAWNEQSYKYLRRGRLDGRSVHMLVDTGSDRTMVAADFIESSKVNGSYRVLVVCVHGDTVSYPTAVVQLQVGTWQQQARVVVVPELPVAVLLGRDLYDPVDRESPTRGLMVVTRSAKKKAEQDVANSEDSQGLSGNVPSDESASSEETTADSEKLAPEVPTEVTESHPPTESGSEVTGTEDKVQEGGEQGLPATAVELIAWQQSDPTLEKACGLVIEGPAEERVYFYQQEGLLYRHWEPKGSAGLAKACEQLVLPKQCRLVVLRLAHDVPMTGHLGITKTKDRILQRYYWPGIFSEVARYCKSCEVCQKSQPRRPARAEMVPMPLVPLPFQRVAMDIVGPLPRTKRGNQFILTFCDYATRYPEAVPLPSVEAPRVAKELMSIFSRLGILEQILTDQGTNFMSATLEEVYRLLQVKRIRTSPYHPQTDGLVERFNATLKLMLKKFVNKKGKDWDEYLPYLLFAYREVPQESTGFSPFELLFGRRVRGPLDVLKEAWTAQTGEETPAIVHMMEMRERLQDMADVVKEAAEKAQIQQKSHYDQHARREPCPLGTRR